MHQINDPKHYRISLHHLGFRPFFLLGSLFAVLSIAIWMWLYHSNASLLLNEKLPVMAWHAHEMVYGYTLAVIAGFILTAVRNWTGVQTLHGAPLLFTALLWSGARILPYFHFPQALQIMAILDLAFNLVLVIAVLHPIIKVRQWKQAGIWALLTILMLGNGLFYLGLFDKLESGINLGLYSGLYGILFLVLVMGRRVIPFFIEKGVDEQVTIQNRAWLDISIMIVMPVFLVAEVFLRWSEVAAFTALLLFILQSIRLYDWHTAAIWKKPLLWSLFISFAWIAAGFAMKAISYVVPLNPMLTTHAFAYGGIGLLTISMMCRVSLGHTGRNVFEPPPVLKWMFMILIAGAIMRVLMPIFLPAQTDLWIGLSQVMWIISFGSFLYLYTPILIKPRIDGSYG